MFDIYDKSNYKECRHKRYKAYMCILPEGTLVRPIHNTISLIFHDKLDSLYADKLEVIKKEIQMKVTRVITKDAPFLVVEPAGKFLILNFSQVVQNYKLDINNSYREITREILEPRIVNNYMDWVGVVPSFRSTNKMVACFVRKSEKFSIPGVGNVNTSGRGKGDFLICNQLPNNNIDFSSMRIVSNNYFSATFDNRGYEAYLDTYNYSLVMADLPRLPIPVKENNNTTKKDELDKLYSLILSKSKYYCWVSLSLT